MSVEGSNFYVTGGTLRPDAASYVERQADKDLLDGLLKGEFCYVLTSRQMGKSSLMVRTAQKLRAQGINVVALDLTAIGQNLTPEQWYDGLIVSMGRQLRLEDELEAFWMKNTQLSPVQRLMLAIREVALMRRPGPLVVFVDEIDIVVSLPFASDEFFAAIRECYNRRTEDPELGRLRFCLLGVATPSDLIRDARLTPFNVGQRIELSDFTNKEAAPLGQGLNVDGRHGQKLLRRVLYWTSGHPYLTQRLCRTIAEDPTATSVRDIDRLCRELFLSSRARERDDNLLFVRERLVNGSVSAAAVLTLHLQILTQRRPVGDSEKDPALNALRLSGVVRSAEGRMQIRNRIYRTVFDREWALSNLPDQEARRQRLAYRRGFATALKGVGYLLAAILLVAFGWWVWSNIPPHVVIPDPKMPVPNGYDRYKAAIEALTETNWVSSIIWKLERSLEKPSIAEVQAAVQKNRSALSLVREGFAHESRHPRILPLDLHESVALGQLFQLFRLEGWRNEARDDWTAASHSYMDLVRFGEDLNRGTPVFFRHLVASRTGRGLAQMGAIMDHLDATEAKRAARVAESILRTHVPFSETLEEEKWEQQAELAGLFRRFNWRLVHVADQETFAKAVLGPGEHSKLSGIVLRFAATFPFSKRGLFKACTAHMDDWIFLARSCYPMLPINLQEPTLDYGPFGGTLDFPFGDYWREQLYLKSQLGLLSISLALRSYQLEKGSYPLNLAELVPAYLEKIPDDPFALIQVFRYKPGADGYLLYSLGPDGKDDGGTESTNRITDRYQKGDIRLKSTDRLEVEK